MQEITPASASGARPHHRRYIIAATLGITLLLAYIIAIFSTWHYLTSTQKLGHVDGAVVSITGAIFILAVLSYPIASVWRYIKKTKTASEIEVLLPEFVQTSDHFTRPRRYVHRHLLDMSHATGPKRFAHLLRVRSEGKFIMPSMTTNTLPSEGEYTVMINIDEEIYSLERKFSVGDSNDFELNRLKIPNDLRIVHMRIMVDKHSKVTPGDFDLDGIELEAFLKTLELGRLFLNLQRNGK